MQDNKRRLPRVEQDQVTTVHEDENAHLWAVSYSDFLMALLSFFILFFSMDTPQRQKLILNLADNFATKSGAGTGFKDDGYPPSDKRMPANIMDSLKSMKVDIAPDRESLVVHFPDDFFLPGQHLISREHSPAIHNFLEVLKPYEGEVNLYFEGHADQKPLQKAKNNIIIDNFVLSSLRASSALLIAKQMGFPERNLYIQAASSNLRNSRSLSIRIEPKEEAAK